jgi:hypothetical protein
MQEIVGSLLYYARAVDSKLLVAVSMIAACQAKATVATEQAVNLLLDYVATYPNDLGCAFLQESPEFPRIRRNLGSKKKELRSFFCRNL